MKISFLFGSLTLSLLSASAFAQSERQPRRDRPRERPPVNLVEKADRLVGVIERFGRQMSPEQEERVEALIDEAIGVARGLPNRVKNILVNVGFESTAFSLKVDSLEDLVDQCATKFREARLTSIDDIDVSVDFQPVQRLHNAGWWNTAELACNAIAQLAQPQGVKISRFAPSIILRGNVEGNAALDFAVEGNSRGEVGQQCLDHFQKNPIGSADDLFVSKNFEVMKAIHNPGWWNTPQSICEAILNAN
jgi:hypothetical protein